MLEGSLGDTFRPKLVTRAYFLTMFGAGWILESIFEAKVSIFFGSLRGSAAVAGLSGGGGGKPPELLQVSYQQSSTPCYLCRGAAD